MPLQTGFKRIGSAGKTVDGRNVQKNWLSEMAESYDAEKYGAVINLNHWDPRWAGSYGKVLALKLGEKDGNPILLANIEPKEQLIALAKQEVLYTSMEINTNFQDTGKAYLTGLALTPKPASVGTEELKFSCGQPKDETHLFSEFLPVELSFSEQETETEEAKFFTKLKNFFAGSTHDQSTPDEHLTTTDPEDDSDMSLSKEQAEKLTVALTALTEKLETFSQGGQPAEEPKTLEEQFAELQAEHKDLQAKYAQLEKGEPEDKGEQSTELSAIQEQLTKLSEQLKQATGEQPGTDFGVQTGGEAEDHFV
ncbi:hypothetical protein HC723_07655 [Vibrio sp. S11_S32]|uniref:GPO family capsid scaffolding protein n=1 Tax=Vibrio sp. S11_S32 TaxID=2720225 RepID=UPI0016802AFC|nr:GPO family capsid scaffolding protein [Vibrio sp. S11_S32]MBD1576309.1 hypothetical protein [Vibrio sp. S11_S32]